jgi:hypothetical protein
MVSDETRKRSEAISPRVVVVDRLKYDELLVSRRKLERIGDRDDRLHDLETHEIFVVEDGAEIGLARHA